MAAQRQAQKLADDRDVLRVFMEEAKAEANELLEERMAWWTEEELLKHSLEMQQDQLNSLRAFKRFKNMEAELEDTRNKAQELELENIGLKRQVRHGIEFDATVLMLRGWFIQVSVGRSMSSKRHSSTQSCRGRVAVARKGGWKKQLPTVGNQKEVVTEWRPSWERARRICG